ncbi:amidoligase family protein [Marinobacter sp. SS21]|uniref:amidoligase family protein n=1 Tax=Marinobacter sp. SS21 TaxID=2979460 RepID=UPI00232D04D5|nr:amidoligase family protein [Marinobacter sp. SS21]MDC0662185.1 amidoligase family protein [Marinobacter sp. SS21]
MDSPRTCRLPDICFTKDQSERRVGIEIEISGLSYRRLVDLAAGLLDGTAVEESRYISRIRSGFGDFTIELDSDPIKDLDLQDEELPEALRELGEQAMQLIDAAAEKIVPLEIVTPPIRFTDLERIEHLCDQLRDAGALGSREAIYYAFALQLNPELPDLRTDTLVRYLRVFACLYDWLKARHQLDISRKLTSYIEPWDNLFVDRLIAPNYAPTRSELMVDYLRNNPTRNRALDLLPLFAFIDPELVLNYTNDPRIKARPTLHYRLPDCDIDNPQWHFSTVWNDWVVVEQLAHNAADLADLMIEFRTSRKLNLHNLTHNWLDTCHQWLQKRGYV